MKSKPKKLDAPMAAPINKKSRFGFLKTILKLLIFAGIVILIWKSRQSIINYIHGNPYLSPVYDHMFEQISQQTLLGLFYATFVGAIFFVSLPVEAIFIIYITLGYNLFYLIAIAILGNLLGMIFNYGFGFILGPRVVKFFMGDSFEKFERWVNKGGIFVLTVGNIVIFPIEPIAVVFGAFRYPFKRYVYYTATAKFLKFILLSIGYYHLLPYIPSIKEYISNVRTMFNI